MAANTVLLKTSDEKSFSITEEVANQSELLASLIKEREDPKEVIPLLNIEGEVFQKAIEWMEYHSTNPMMYTDKPEDRNRFSELNPYDIKFCDDLDKCLLFELFKASITLQIPMLVESCARCVARNLVGKTPEQMREYLNEENDYTQEEMEELRKKFAH